MSTLSELKDKIAKGEKVHIPNLGFYCALYSGELRCFDKNSDAKKPMELHLDMDEILSHKWEIYNGDNQKRRDAIEATFGAFDKITKMCDTFDCCGVCPFENKKGRCELKEQMSIIAYITPNNWSSSIRSYFRNFDNERGIDFDE